MYIFIEDADRSPFVWFLTEARSICEVATMVQRKQLSMEHIKRIKRTIDGESLMVRLSNTSGYTFIPHKKYFLYLMPNEDNNVNNHLNSDVNIQLVFEEGDRVSRLWRMPTEPITKETWNLLFPPVVVPSYKVVPADDNVTGLRPQKYKKIRSDDDYKLQVVEVYPEDISESAEFGPDDSPELPTPDSLTSGSHNSDDPDTDLDADPDTDLDADNTADLDNC